jgi:hypothetical protein
MYSLYLIILFIFCLLDLFLPLLVLIWTEGCHDTNEGVTKMGVGWASGESSNLVGPPLNLVLYMHLRIFAYTSNTLIASFEYMDCMLASGTLKNFRFLLKSCLFTERAPVMKLICSTLQTSICITLLMALRRDSYWRGIFLPKCIRS